MVIMLFNGGDGMVSSILKYCGEKSVSMSWDSFEQLVRSVVVRVRG